MTVSHLGRRGGVTQSDETVIRAVMNHDFLAEEALDYFVYKPISNPGVEAVEGGRGGVDPNQD